VLGCLQYALRFLQPHGGDRMIDFQQYQQDIMLPRRCEA
jgi:hypothetical protein